MRNLKKLMAVVITVALLASVIVVAPTSANTLTDAEKCEALGMITGTGAGVNATYLASQPLRYQAAILFLRLLGKEAEALTWKGTVNFTDVAGDARLSASNKALLAYLKVHPEFGFGGYLDGSFRPFEPMTAAMYYKILLIALGYRENIEFTYDNVLLFAASKGLSAIYSVKDLTIDHICIATIEALGKKAKGSTITLLQDLVEVKKVIPTDKAVTSGLYAIPTAAVTFNSNGGSAVASATVVKDTVVTKPEDPTKADHLFAGWFKDAALTTPWNFTTDKVTANTTIYAKWTDNKLYLFEVKGENLAEVVVTYTKAMATPNKAHYKVGGTEATAVRLSDDKKSVIVTVPSSKISAENGPMYKIEINKDVKDVDGYTLGTAKTIEFRVFDTTLPYITSVNLTGPQTFEVIFNEPIKDAGTVTINDGVYGISSTSVSGNKAIVTIAASQLPAGSYNVKVVGFKDYAGFTMIGDTQTLAYVKDTTTPTASISGTPGQTEVVVEFNKPVKLNDSQSYVDYFYHTFTAWKPSSVAATSPVNGFAKKYTLTFNSDAYPIPPGSTSLVILSKGQAGVEIVDEWGNKVTSNIILPITVVSDTTAPEVKEVKFINEKKVEVYFTKSVNSSQATTAGNFVVKDPAGTAKAPNTLTYNSTDKKTILEWNDNLGGGVYTVEIKNIEDTTLNKNKIATVTKNFTVTDKTPITTSSVTSTVVLAGTGTNDVFYVSFPEIMDMNTSNAASVLNKSNYLILKSGSSTPVALDSKATIEQFGTSQKIVKITNPKTTGLTDDDQSKLIIGRVADSAGNVPVELSFSVNIAKEAAATVTSVKQTDYNKLTVEFNKVLTSVLADAFEIKVGSSTYKAASIESKVDGTDKTTVVVNLTASTVAALKGVDTAYETETSKTIASVGELVYLVGQHVVTVAGMKSVDAEITDKVSDARIPVYKSIAKATGKAVITFSEALKNDVYASLYAFDIEVKDASGKVKTPGTDYQTAVDADGKLEVIGAGTSNWTIATKSSITYMKDVAGNKVEVFAAKKVP